MRRIVVAVDGSEPSLRAADFDAELAAGTAAELVILTVLDHGYLGDQSLKQFARGAPDRVGRSPGDQGRADSLDREAEGGGIAEELARFARATDPDMLVVGHTGRNRIAGVVFESVVLGLLTLSSCPLTVVR